MCFIPLKSRQFWFRMRLLGTKMHIFLMKMCGGTVGLVVKALAFHHCGLGLISTLGVICGLSLLVLYSALRGFFWVLQFSPLIKNQHLIWFDLLNNNCKNLEWFVDFISSRIVKCIWSYSHANLRCRNIKHYYYLKKSTFEVFQWFKILKLFITHMQNKIKSVMSYTL